MSEASCKRKERRRKAHRTGLLARLARDNGPGGSAYTKDVRVLTVGHRAGRSLFEKLLWG